MEITKRSSAYNVNDGQKISVDTELVNDTLLRVEVQVADGDMVMMSTHFDSIAEWGET